MEDSKRAIYEWCHTPGSRFCSGMCGSYMNGYCAMGWQKLAPIPEVLPENSEVPFYIDKGWLKDYEV